MNHFMSKLTRTSCCQAKKQQDNVALISSHPAQTIDTNMETKAIFDAVADDRSSLPSNNNSTINMMQERCIHYFAFVLAYILDSSGHL